MVQRFQNFTSDTLASAISNSDTTIVVSDGTKWPSGGDFYVRIDNEIIKITARSGANLTAVRAQDGTAAASHSSGVGINWVLAEATMEGFRRDNTDHGTTVFSPGYEGRIYVSDLLPYFSRDNGSDVTDFGPMYRMYKPPALASWTQVNMSGGTVSDVGGGVMMLAPTTGGQDMKLLERSRSTPPWTVECQIRGIRYDRYNATGMFVRDAGGRIHGIQNVLGGATGPYLEIVKFTNPTTYNSSGNFGQTWDMYPHPTWFQIHNDGTDLHFKYSVTGIKWKTLQQISRTNWLTGAVTGVGVWANSTNGSVTTGVVISSYREF